MAKKQIENENITISENQPNRVVSKSAKRTTTILVSAITILFAAVITLLVVVLLPKKNEGGESEIKYSETTVTSFNDEILGIMGVDGEDLTESQEIKKEIVVSVVKSFEKAKISEETTKKVVVFLKGLATKIEGNADLEALIAEPTVENFVKILSTFTNIDTVLMQIKTFFDTGVTVEQATDVIYNLLVSTFGTFDNHSEDFGTAVRDAYLTLIADPSTTSEDAIVKAFNLLISKYAVEQGPKAILDILLDSKMESSSKTLIKTFVKVAYDISDVYALSDIKAFVELIVDLYKGDVEVGEAATTISNMATKAANGIKAKGTLVSEEGEEEVYEFIKITTSAAQTIKKVESKVKDITLGAVVGVSIIANMLEYDGSVNILSPMLNLIDGINASITSSVNTINAVLNGVLNMYEKVNEPLPYVNSGSTISSGASAKTLATLLAEVVADLGSTTPTARYVDLMIILSNLIGELCDSFTNDLIDFEAIDKSVDAIVDLKDIFTGVYNSINPPSGEEPEEPEEPVYQVYVDVLKEFAYYLKDFVCGTEDLAGKRENGFRDIPVYADLAFYSSNIILIMDNSHYKSLFNFLKGMGIIGELAETFPDGISTAELMATALQTIVEEATSGNQTTDEIVQKLYGYIMAPVGMMASYIATVPAYIISSAIEPIAKILNSSFGLQLDPSGLNFNSLLAAFSSEYSTKLEDFLRLVFTGPAEEAGA